MTTVLTAQSSPTPAYGIYLTTSSLPSNQVTEASHARDMANASLITTEVKFEDAVELAFMFAEEHAARLQVEAKRSGNTLHETGGCLVTNNGSWVWYSAKPLAV